MTTSKLLLQLVNLRDDFETGYIANPSAAADRKREKHQRTVEDVIKFINEQIFDSDGRLIVT